MDNFLSRDSRIDDNTALRDLEKKVHWLITQVGWNTGILDNAGGGITIPDDLIVNDVYTDYKEVQDNVNNITRQTSGGGGKGPN